MLDRIATCLLAGLAACASPNSLDDAMPGGDAGVDAPPFTDGVSTLAGGAEPGFVDGPRGLSRFANPVNVAIGPDGKLYVADFDNGKLRVVDAATGQTATVIAQEDFRRPFGMAFAGDTLYVSTDIDDTGGFDSMSGTIWRVDVAAKTATVVVRRIGRPRGIAALPDGRLALSDYAHHVIQILDPRNASLTRLAGTWDVGGMVDGVNAKFQAPYGIVAFAGKLAVADFDNNRIRLVGLDGKVETLSGQGAAGFVDGAVGAAMFARPQALAVAASGDLYVTDLGNYRVRRIRDGVVDSVAGDGVGGFLDNDDRLAARLYGLEGLSVAADGTELFVADGGRGDDVPYNRVRRIELD